jgi:hypothetical protein
MSLGQGITMAIIAVVVLFLIAAIIVGRKE